MAESLQAFAGTADAIPLTACTIAIVAGVAVREDVVEEPVDR